jgi:tetratricopeptide (TPR) repeat protein
MYGEPVDAFQVARVAAWLGPACFITLSAAWFFLLNKGWISPVVFALLMLLNLPLTVGAVFAVNRAVTLASAGLVKAIYAAGDIEPEPSYPRQDVLIVRGKYEEAADCFRDHLTIEPQDHEARLRLAHLLETHLRGYDEAERLYLEVRRAEPAAEPRQQMHAANGLIDLYRKLGRKERLMVELARFVDRYGGSKLAAGAARELKELKRELTSESPHSPT